MPRSIAPPDVYVIEPPYPPFPTAWNLLFHCASGIHTSILISESLEGLSVAATRQNAGSCLNVTLACAPAGPVTVAENSPAATGCATVMAVFGSDKASKLSHVAACDSDVNRTSNRLKPKV